jgi:hypothetical protein
MLESYGMTLGIYPFGVYLDNNKTVPISGDPDYWSTYFRLLLPKAGKESITGIKSVVRDCSWKVHLCTVWLATMTSNEFKQGFGYVTNSIAFDCIQPFWKIAFCTNYSTRNPPPPSQAFVSISNLPSIHEQTATHCETYGKNWYVNGAWVASTYKSSNVVHLVVGAASINQLLQQSLEPCVPPSREVSESPTTLKLLIF